MTTATRRQRRPVVACDADFVATVNIAATLSGRWLTGIGAVTYAWTIVTKPGGSTAAIGSPTSLTSATFTPDVAGSYVFKLTATNQYGSGSDLLTMVATAAAPIVVADPDYATIVGREDILAGLLTFGETPTYLWTIDSAPGGSAATVSNNTSLTAARFIPDVAGSYTLRVTATNAFGSGFDTLVITATAADYYVSNAGSDGNAGTYALPKATIGAAITAVAGAASKTVALLRGSLFRGDGAGTPAVPAIASTGFTLTDFGTLANPKPIVSGADVYTSWSAHTSLIYKSALTVSPGHVYVDGVWLKKAASLATLTSAGMWWWESNFLYVRTFKSLDPTGLEVVEGSQRTQAMKCQTTAATRQNGTVERINFQGGKSYGFHLQCNFAAGNDGWTFRECSYTLNQSNGLFVDASNGVSAAIPIDDCLVDSCYSTLNGKKGQEFYGKVSNGEFVGCISENDGVSPVDGGSGDSRAGIDIIASDLQSGSYPDSSLTVERATDCVIHGCVASYAGVSASGWTVPTAVTGTGIWCDHPGTGTEVHHNISHHNKSRGFNVEAALDGGTAGQFDNVRTYANIAYSIRGGSGTGFIGSRSSLNCLWANNVAYDCDRGYWFQSQVNDAQPDRQGWSNNLIVNNISDNCTVDLYTRRGAANNGTDGTGNVYTYNCFDAEGTNFIDWGTVTYSTYAAFRTAVGATTNPANIAGDPGLTAPASGDFTLTGASICRNAGTPVTGVTTKNPPDLGYLPDAA